MINQRYVFWYVLLAAIGIIAGTIPIVLSGNVSSPMPIVSTLIIALILPPILIWLMERMGYPLSRPVTCPRCGTEMPLFRKPTSAKQGMLGGYTCPKCGMEMDAAGRELR